MTSTPDPKAASALSLLKELQGVVVALSGGVDSAVLLALATQALGPDRVLAATTVSAALAGAEQQAAAQVAAFVGVEHREVRTDELSNPRYRANAGDRCYHCRAETFAALRRLAAARGWEVAYGAIVDDLGDVRPGMAAAERLGIRAPLLAAEMKKEDVRRIAREFGLPVHDKPAAACLSSRIPAGIPVTEERLGRIERAEAALARLGFGQFRVRHHEELARLELDPEGSAALRDRSLQRRVLAAVRAAGYRHVTVDLGGYRVGGARRAQRPERVAADH